MKVMALFSSRPARAALAFLPLCFATSAFLDCPSASAADTTSPTVSITKPVAGSTVTNGTITIIGTAHDNVGVANVNYSLNNSDYVTADTLNNWTNWTAIVGVTPGTNMLRVYAADAVGNHSATNKVTFIYVLKASLSVLKNGQGTFNTNYNGVKLNVGQRYSITATAAAGFRFNGWTGGASTASATVSFIMEPGLSLTANFLDIAPPTVAITKPLPNTDVTNANITVAGTAGDNSRVANVNYSVNHGDFVSANTTNNWANWSAVVGVTPGTNNLRVYSTDAAGNRSVTNGVNFFYVVKATASFVKVGKGTFSTNYNNVPLEIGQHYSVTATPATGFKFTGWTGNANTTSATLTFLMAPGLTFVANFQDVARPTVAITSPAAGQQVANQNFLIMGTAADNLAVASVSYQLNHGGWTPAQTFNNGRNWMASVMLLRGSNFVQAFSMDTTGHFSTTNNVGFTYAPPRDWAPTSVQGMVSEVSPASAAPFNMFFGFSTFSETDGGSIDFNGVGNYTYDRLTTNTARLTVTFTKPPPAVIGTTVIDLTFDGVDSATYNNETLSGDTGVINFFSTPVLAPVALTNTTIHAIDSAASGITLTLATTTFKQKDSNGATSSGNYTYTRYSPAVGLLVLSYSAPSAENGATNYLQLTFTEAGGGNVFFTAFDAQGNFGGTDSGTFTNP